MLGIFDAEVYGTCQHCRIPVGCLSALLVLSALSAQCRHCRSPAGRQVASAVARSPGRQVARSPVNHI
eukprot:3184235-Prymnesium_polylepis.1